MLSVCAILLMFPAEAPGESGVDDTRITPIVLAYRKTSPAVVNISTTRLVQIRSGFFGRDIFEELFPTFPSRRTRKVPVHSLGSGFLINSRGYIVTNAHVVRQAESITVTLVGGAKYPAEVISSDTESDLAVLKVDPPADLDLPYLPLGRSDDLMVGETVIAIGNPLGYANTLTTGVISATNRTLSFRNDVEVRGLIQTDAPINRGNSGGPLLNIKGELIGINTAIRADAQNIGFAIPVDRLVAELVNLLDPERLNRAVFGASVTQKRGAETEELHVAAVRPNTPADGKLRPADRIIELNGEPLRQISEYTCAMLAVEPGETAKLKVLRGGRELTVDVKIARKPKPDGKALGRQLFGMRLRTLTPQLARDLRLSIPRGLLVVGVDPESPAQQLGVEPEDVLFQVDRFYVTDLDNLGTILEDIRPGQKVTIGIVRRNTRVLVDIASRKGDSS
jgi:serine protease Do